MCPPPEGVPRVVYGSAGEIGRAMHVAAGIALHGNVNGDRDDGGDDDDDDDDTPPPPPLATTAEFPEVTTWTDQQLITAVELADRREPSLRLHATDNAPDRYESLLDECSAELVRRLEARGVRLSA